MSIKQSDREFESHVERELEDTTSEIVNIGEISTVSLDKEQRRKDCLLHSPMDVGGWSIPGFAFLHQLHTKASQRIQAKEWC
jgi:hypothetical protein